MQSARQMTFGFSDSCRAKRLEPLLKWAGGKENELKYIKPKLPEKFDGYYEPFVVGGAVYTAVRAERYFINDKSDELINLYKVVAAKQAEFFDVLNEVDYNWEILSRVVPKQNEFLLTAECKFNKI